MKLVTFSFDDGTVQDRRLVALLNEYGMKATFNLCSNEWGQIHTIDHLGVVVDHSELPETEVEELYKGHEVACHTKTHPSNLDELSAETVVAEVEENRRALELLVGYPITGLAYPWGKWNADIMEILRTKTPIKYARTTRKATDYSPPEDWLAWHPSGSRATDPALTEEIYRFLEAPNAGIQILYIWGHSFEFDKSSNGWQVFEEALKILSSTKNLIFCTNSQVLDFVEKNQHTI